MKVVFQLWSTDDDYLFIDEGWKTEEEVQKRALHFLNYGCQQMPASQVKWVRIYTATVKMEKEG